MKVFSQNFINNYLTAIATYNPQGEFIIFGDRRITWAELHSRTNRLGHGLLTLGINKGDKVAFMFHNTPEFIEINYAIHYGMLSIDSALEGLDARPERLHVICTGRNAHPRLIEAADLVSEIKEIKHPFHQGILAQRGIDY